VSNLKKKEGFQGQRAIVIPPPILASVCESNPIVKQLYVTDIGYYPNALHHHRHRPRGSAQNILIYCVSGKGWVKIGKEVHPVSAGKYALLPAHVPHEYKAEEDHPWTIYWVHFQGDNSKNYINLFSQKNGQPVSSISFQQNRISLFEEIYSTLERGYSTDNVCYANMSLQYFLATCCFDSNYNFKLVNEKKDNIDLCISYMQKNTERMLTLKEISSVVNLSPAHITTLFKKKTGFSIIEYFNQLKIQKACQFLLFTDLRINEIADKLGIEDPYYFTRLFTKIIGVSPLKYRSKRMD
jgi:AraC-like DNA-binding protein